MKLRSDHVTGAAFVGFGALVIALSGDLPIGRLSMPGAGFMPNLIAWLLIGLGILLVLRANESAPLADIEWNDFRHALSVMAACGVAVLLYTWLGFIITMFLMMFGLLVLVEQRKMLRAGLYSLVVVVLAFRLFDNVLRAPLPTGPFGF